jgi:NADH-quinone oxidoreductase subunit K
VIAALATPTTTWYVLLAAVLFSIGVVGVMVRRNPLVLFMCIELMLNAVNLSFVAFSYELKRVDGHLFTFFVMVVAAAEAAVGLAIVIALFRLRETTDVDDINLLRW